MIMRRLGLIVCLSTFAVLLVAGSASANSAWWHLTSGSRPTNLAPGSEGAVVVVAENLGDAPVAASESPVTIADTLPVGLTATAIHAGLPHGNTITPISCAALPALSCSLEADLSPYRTVEIRIRVAVSPSAAAGEANYVAISGGGAPAASLEGPLLISSEATPFGLEDFESNLEEAGGWRSEIAASHPFQFTTSVLFNQGEEEETTNGKPIVSPAFLPKNVDTGLPAGLIGDPSPFAVCPLAKFNHLISGGGINPEENKCPAQSAIGVTTVTIQERFIGYTTVTVPLFNLEPAFGDAARFGFAVPTAGATIVLDARLRDERGPLGEAPDYGITVNAENITQQVGSLAANVTVWGVPGDSAHDASRGWACLAESFGFETHGPCPPSTEAHPPAFLTMPTSCSGPLQSSVLAASWDEPSLYHAFFPPTPLQALGACNQVPFAPTIHSEPTSNAATSPTGLGFDLNFPSEGLTNSNEGAKAESNLKKAVVTLPQGFTANPSIAEGLKACSEAEYEAATVKAGTDCTPESKVGEVEIESPAIESRPERVIKGGLFVAKQGENPYGNLLTLYLIARAPELGIVVRQALKVTPDHETGRLTTEVDNIPQLPFSDFHLNFRQGQRSPLITPPACGEYSVHADLYPYSEPNAPDPENSPPFQINQGPEGQGCPSGGVPPFHPSLLAGSENPTAGAYSPFYIDIQRRDSEQEITHFSIKLPPGVVGKLAGIPLCSDAAIAAAKAREHEGGGAEELANPSCSAASQVGTTNVGTGVGNVLAYASGKLYLAGPYHGAPISIVSITAAKVGPFDLGTVVVREALRVNPETAEVFVDATGSDPIPHIVDGIPVHLRDIQVFVDRPEFVLNPTSCDKTSTASTVLGAGLDFASEADDVPVTVTSPFQVGSCASLPFKPKLSLKLKGGTKRAAHPALKATLKMNGIGEASIGKAQVTLPKSEFLENAHIRTICTRVQFKEGNGNGEKCPPASIYGFARAKTPILSEPLEGPVFLRASEHELPDLVAALHGSEINVDLVGRIDSLHGQIRNTFETIPDAPVESFTLEMQGGSKGLLVNSTNLCKGKHRAIVNFTGHNGKISDTTPAVGAKCSARKHKGKHKHPRRHRRARRHR